MYAFNLFSNPIQVEDILDDESDTEEETSNKEVEIKNSNPSDILPRSRSNSSSSSSVESLTGEFPRGFKRARAESAAKDINDESSNDEFPSSKLQKREQLENDLDLGQESNSEGSVEPPDEVDDGEWNIMGAALEREFLSNN